MSNYSEEANSVRVDFFRPSGKWYETEAVRWLGYDGPIYAEFKNSLENHLGGRYSGMTAVCLEPYNVNAFPLMLEIN